MGPWSSASSFATPPVPGAITLVSPVNESTTADWKPTFTWNVEATSDSYLLYVYKKSGSTVTVMHNQWYTSADASCGAETCSVTPDVTLGGGTYYWSVRGKNPSGNGPWSAVKSFTNPPAPEQVILCSPANVSTTADWNPTFAWETSVGAQTYQLYIYKKSGTTTTVVHSKSYTFEEAGCGDGTCEIKPNITLGGGTYYWKVRGINPSGKGKWSSAWSLTTPAKPGQVSLIAPTVTANTTTPEFSWNSVERAEEYILYVYMPNGTVVHNAAYTPAEALCDSDTVCSITPPGLTLKNGKNYLWKVRAKNPSGKGAWSDVLAFQVTAE